MPILAASPKSWTASETMAMLPVRRPPMASKIENERLSKKAMRILREVCIVFSFVGFIKAPERGWSF